MNEKQFDKLASLVLVLLVLSPLFPSSVGMANEPACPSTDYTLLNTYSLEYIARESSISFFKWAEGKSSLMYKPTIGKSRPIESVNYSQILLPKNFSLEGYNNPKIIWSNDTHKICTCTCVNLNNDTHYSNRYYLGKGTCCLIEANGDIYPSLIETNKDIFYPERCKEYHTIVFYNGYIIADGNYDKNILDQWGNPVLEDNFRDTQKYCGLIVSRTPCCSPDRVGEFTIIAQEYNPWF